MKYFLLILFATFLNYYSNAQETELIKAEVDGTSITIIDSNVYVNCGAKFKWENISSVSEQINILFTDTSSQRMKCMCLFTLRTTIKFLKPGTYSINVSRKEWESGDVKQIGNLKAVVSDGPVMPPLSYIFNQSDCYSHTDIAFDKDDPDTKRMYPNPASGDASFEFVLDKPGSAVLSIFDIYGNKVSTHVLPELLEGNNKININCSLLPQGAYNCTIMTDNNERKNFKFILNK